MCFCTSHNYAFLELLEVKASLSMCLQGQLIIFRVDDNRLNGTLSGALGNLSKIVYADLASNSFVGHVPDTWSNWTQVGRSYPLLRLSLVHAYSA